MTQEIIRSMHPHQYFDKNIIVSQAVDTRMLYTTIKDSSGTEMADSQSVGERYVDNYKNTTHYRGHRPVSSYLLTGSAKWRVFNA